MTSHTARTLGYLRRRGFLVEVVEKYIRTPQGGFRRDLFKIADVVAIDPDNTGVLFVQVCRTDDIQAHLAKLRSPEIYPNVVRVLKAGNRVSVMAWALRGAAGKRKRYTLTTVPVGMTRAVVATMLLLAASSASAETVCIPALPAKSATCERVVDTTNGPHVVGFRVHDAAGNVQDQTVTIMVNNAVAPKPPQHLRISEN